MIVYADNALRKKFVRYINGLPVAFFDLFLSFPNIGKHESRQAVKDQQAAYERFHLDDLPSSFLQAVKVQDS